MCELLLSPTVDSELAKLGTLNRQKLEQRLLKCAGQDNVENAAGLELLLDQVKPWSKVADLKFLRKYRIGRHRFYIAGQNTDCRFIIQATLLNKRDEDDKPREKNFQKMILNSTAVEEDCLKVKQVKVNDNDG